MILVARLKNLKEENQESSRSYSNNVPPALNIKISAKLKKMR
jgi:hypothetical protein